MSKVLKCLAIGRFNGENCLRLYDCRSGRWNVGPPVVSIQAANDEFQADAKQVDAIIAWLQAWKKATK